LSCNVYMYRLELVAHEALSITQSDFEYAATNNCRYHAHTSSVLNPQQNPQAQMLQGNMLDASIVYRKPKLLLEKKY
jgi:hypothetical protein